MQDIPTFSVVEYRHSRKKENWRIGILAAYEELPGWNANYQIERPVFKNKNDTEPEGWEKIPWRARDLVRPIEWVTVKTNSANS